MTVEDKTMTVLTRAELDVLDAAYHDPQWSPGEDIGDTPQTACTIARGWYALNGQLIDDYHPCVSEVVRKWVIHVQDVMPAEIRSSPEWRDAAIDIWTTGGATQDVEDERLRLALEWMWTGLGDESVWAAVPSWLLPRWQTMLAQRTETVARQIAGHHPLDVKWRIRSAATFTCAALESTDVSDTCDAIAGALQTVATLPGSDLWIRLDPAGMLRRLCAAGDTVTERDRS